MCHVLNVMMWVLVVVIFVGYDSRCCSCVRFWVAIKRARLKELFGHKKESVV